MNTKTRNDGRRSRDGAKLALKDREIIELGFRKIPMCELLKTERAIYFTHRRGKWLFISDRSVEDWNEYFFRIADFFESPTAAVDHLAHLSEKSWFDAADFVRMMHRFRRATDSFGAI